MAREEYCASIGYTTFASHPAVQSWVRFQKIPSAVQIEPEMVREQQRSSPGAESGE
jgi:hypothetical protein